MSKKSKRRSRSEQARRRGRDHDSPKASGSSGPERNEESAAAHALTTFWMLCVMASLMSLVASLGFTFVINTFEQQWSPEFRQIPDLILFVGSATGIIGLVLTWLVRVIRRVAVPTTMVLVAVIGCLLPIAVRILSVM